MNIFKSLFISAFAAYVSFAFGYAALQLFRGMEPLVSWLGLALAAGAPLGFFAWLYIAGPVRTSRHPLLVSVICGLGVVLTMTVNWQYGDASGIVHLWAGLSLLGWFAYIRWYSVFGSRKSTRLKTGSLLPEFELESVAGETVSSAQFRGKYHVLVFYRGNWCPLCSAQVTELAAHYRDLEQMRAEVILISSQPHGHSLSLSQKFDAPMQFLHDAGNAAAEKLGILSPLGTPLGLQALGYPSDTAMPTVIITDPNGLILFADLTDNYRIRPEPGYFLKVLTAHQEK